MDEERAAAGERRRGNQEGTIMKWRSVRTSKLEYTYIDFGGGFGLA